MDSAAKIYGPLAAVGAVSAGLILIGSCGIGQEDTYVDPPPIHSDSREGQHPAVHPSSSSASASRVVIPPSPSWRVAPNAPTYRPPRTTTSVPPAVETTTTASQEPPPETSPPPELDTTRVQIPPLEAGTTTSLPSTTGVFTTMVPIPSTVAPQYAPAPPTLRTSTAARLGG